MIRKISRKFSLTETEIKVILFLLIILITGLASKYFFLSEKISQYQKFDYTREDSLFALMGKYDSAKSFRGNTVVIIDSEREVLDFNKDNFAVSSKTYKSSSPHSININKAGLAELVKLPGIGEKTALNIIKYRNAHGDFSTLQDLLNIDGIGPSKLSKIKSFIIFEKQPDSLKIKSK